jgi:epoxyqueuosine reductase
VREAIRQHALGLGFDLCRFTSAAPPQTGHQFSEWLNRDYQAEMSYLKRNSEKRLDPQAVLKGAKTVVSVAMSYWHPDAIDRSVPSSATHGVVARYARHQDYHEVMGTRLLDLMKFLDREWDAECKSLWYVDTGPILEREFAQRAGVGFVGKHTNLISRQLGNWFLLGEILTTAEIESDASEPNRCGSCSRCIPACPTGAIVAPFQLDARRCISYLTIELKGSIPIELRPAIGNRIFGCDDCLAVCPWNRFAKAGRAMLPFHRPDLEAPDLVELLQLDESGFRSRFQGTPLLRAKRRGLLRNVCVALGNVGDSRSIPALQRAMEDPEPLIAEHAEWAIAQILARRMT